MKFEPAKRTGNLKSTSQIDLQMKGPVYRQERFAAIQVWLSPGKSDEEVQMGDTHGRRSQEVAPRASGERRCDGDHDTQRQEIEELCPARLR